MRDFAVSASKLARNPLGILALMIVLVYAIAGLVTSTDGLGSTERLILIIFLVSFPVVVLLTLYILVAKHHDKLYAPTDFVNEDNFVRLIENSPKIRELEGKAEEAMKEAQIIGIKAYEGEVDEAENATRDNSRTGGISDEQQVLQAVRNSRFTYRSLSGIKKEADFNDQHLSQLLDKLVSNELLGKRDRGKGVKYYITDKGLEVLRNARI